MNRQNRELVGDILAELAGITRIESFLLGKREDMQSDIQANVEFYNAGRVAGTRFARQFVADAVENLPYDNDDEADDRVKLALLRLKELRGLLERDSAFGWDLDKVIVLLESRHEKDD